MPARAISWDLRVLYDGVIYSRHSSLYVSSPALERGLWKWGWGHNWWWQTTGNMRYMLFGPQMPYSQALLHVLLLPGCQTSIQLGGHIQREAHNVICVLCLSCAQSTIIYLFIPILKIKREMKTHLFHYFFLHSSAFQLTKIHIYANMRHLFPPLPHMGDGSQARINDIASAVMFAAFH